MKKRIKYFVCYSSENHAIVASLVKKLGYHLNLSKDYRFEKWYDGDIVLGDDWHERIQRAIRDCNIGLLMLSPSFFASKYIKKHELPHFLTKSSKGLNIEKPIAPVGIEYFDLKGDLLGLGATQIYRYQKNPGSSFKFYDECRRSDEKNHFAAKLADQLIIKLNSMYYETT